MGLKKQIKKGKGFDSSVKSRERHFFCPHSSHPYGINTQVFPGRIKPLTFISIKRNFFFTIFVFFSAGDIPHQCDVFERKRSF
jgi:hypothetical protein